MSTDPGLETTRSIREAISREHGNDPRRLIEYYLQYQTKFAGRLRASPRSGPEARFVDRQESPTQG